ncbi:MAG: hypothetical protein KAI29_29865, partial [Cyclobacteriaceae bacterium]|nr:hypothetical protein [Cyclobacteriaceae bacterium]
DELDFNEIVIIHHLNELQLLKKYESVLIGNYKYCWIQEKLIELKIQPSSLTYKWENVILQMKKGIKERLYYFIYKFTNK